MKYGMLVLTHIVGVNLFFVLNYRYRKAVDPNYSYSSWFTYYKDNALLLLIYSQGLNQKPYLKEISVELLKPIKLWYEDQILSFNYLKSLAWGKASPILGSGYASGIIEYLYL